MSGYIWSDEEVLEVLHMRENLGMKFVDIGKKFGVSKSSVLGLCQRVIKAHEATPDHCKKRKNQTGGMPPMWWDKPAKGAVS